MVLVKKDTLALQKSEATLLRYYKSYLQRLEKISKVLRIKGNNMQSANERRMQLGETAVSCMCELLAVHPYFNFSVNITNYILPLLDNKRSSVREKVAQCISQIFKEDKRGELSLTVSYSKNFISVVFYILLRLCVITKLIWHISGKILDSSKIKSVYQVEETLGTFWSDNSVTGPSHQRRQSGQGEGGRNKAEEAHVS